MKKLLLLLLSALLAGFSIVASGAAPDIALAGMDGRQHRLGEYIGNGKWTILNIWGPRCPPCAEEMPELVSFHADHEDKDAQVVGVALDFPSFGYAKRQEVAEFMENYLIDFPMLLGDGEIAGRLGAGPLQGTPTSLVYTPSGKLVAVQVGAVTQEMIENFITRYRIEHAMARQAGQ